MKKNNNKYRNNYSNVYSLNYKFDSCSIAGKISGTALDLIRRYNDLAKEAQGSGNYVDMEIYRQYAEHYRKIVTDINERRQARQEQVLHTEENASGREDVAETPEAEENNVSAPIEPVAEANGYVETLPASSEPVAAKTFQVVEISEEKAPEAEAPKAKKIVRRRTAAPRKKAAEA